MIRIHVMQSRGPGAGRSVRIRIQWHGEELTVDVDEVRRTALALHRAAWWSDAHGGLARRGMADEPAAEALGQLPPGAEGEFQVSIGPRDTIRLSRVGTRVRALVAVADAREMGSAWLRVAESADADRNLARALEHATALSSGQIDDVFAYLRILRSDDPATEVGD